MDIEQEENKNESNMSPTDIYNMMVKGGATPEMAKSAAQAYAKEQYDQRTVKIVPSHYIDSDLDAEVGNKNIKLRVANKSDLYSLIKRIYTMAQQMIADEGMDVTPEEFLNQFSPEAFKDMLIKKVIEIQKMTTTGRNEYPMWYASFLEEVAYLSSNPNHDQVVTKEDLVSCIGGQFFLLLFKIWEVNRQDFLELLGVFEQHTGLKISFLVSVIIWIFEETKMELNKVMTQMKTRVQGEKNQKELLQLMAFQLDQKQTELEGILNQIHQRIENEITKPSLKEQEKALSGGQELTGKSSTSSPSKGKKGSPKKKSEEKQSVKSSS